MYKKLYSFVVEALRSLSHVSARQDEILTGLQAVQQQIASLVVQTAAQPPDAPSAKRLILDYDYTPKVREWNDTRAIRRLREIISARTDDYVTLLGSLAGLQPFFEAIPVHQPRDALSPYWVNGWLPALDALSLYGLLVLNNPRTFVEIGSGNSTKFARQAIKDHTLRTRIVSIDPAPRAEIDQICDVVHRTACEDVGAAFFESLTAEDIVFVDNSHRSFQNSDVTVFFMEILPALPKGTIVGIHDIFLPEDYIKGWEDRYYNEQYLLAAYIFGGMDGGTIILPNWFVSRDPVLKSVLNPVWHSPSLDGLEDRGGIFWLKR